MTVSQLQQSHMWGAVVWPGFQSGHVENRHLFKSLQPPEPQLLDDMLFRRGGMMENWTFPRNSANVHLDSQDRTKPVNTISSYLDRMTNLTLFWNEYTAQYRHQNNWQSWYLLMCCDRPAAVIHLQCFYGLSTNINSSEHHQLTPTVHGTHVIISDIVTTVSSTLNGEMV